MIGVTFPFLPSLLVTGNKSNVQITLFPQFIISIRRCRKDKIFGSAFLEDSAEDNISLINFNRRNSSLSTVSHVLTSTRLPRADKS